MKIGVGPIARTKDSQTTIDAIVQHRYAAWHFLWAYTSALISAKFDHFDLKSIWSDEGLSCTKGYCNCSRLLAICVCVLMPVFLCSTHAVDFVVVATVAAARIG